MGGLGLDQRVSDQPVAWPGTVRCSPQNRGHLSLATWDVLTNYSEHPLRTIFNNIFLNKRGINLLGIGPKAIDWSWLPQPSLPWLKRWQRCLTWTPFMGAGQSIAKAVFPGLSEAGASLDGKERCPLSKTTQSKTATILNNATVTETRSQMLTSWLFVVKRSPSVQNLLRRHAQANNWAIEDWK